MVNRDVFLEYTRKMSLKKHCLQRVHSATLVSKKVRTGNNDAFNKLEPKVQNRELKIAKTVPFSKELKEKKFLVKEKDD